MKPDKIEDSCSTFPILTGKERNLATSLSPYFLSPIIRYRGVITLISCPCLFRAFGRALLISPSDPVHENGAISLERNNIFRSLSSGSGVFIIQSTCFKIEMFSEVSKFICNLASISSIVFSFVKCYISKVYQSCCTIHGWC